MSPDSDILRLCSAAFSGIFSMASALNLTMCNVPTSFQEALKVKKTQQAVNILSLFCPLCLTLVFILPAKVCNCLSFFFLIVFCVFWGFFKAIDGICVLYIYHIWEEEGSLGSQTTSGCGGLVQYQ